MAEPPDPPGSFKRPRRSGLWRHADFMRLWTGETISAFGSQITTLALPLCAILLLRASPVQMGLLQAVGSLPAALFGLAAGAWVDRLPRRLILIAADLGRVFLLCLIPVGAWLGLLRIEALYVAAFLTGSLGLCFDVAYQAYLPSLVERELLLEANSKLQASQSVAQVAGPGLAGALVQLLTAPVAILLDALSLLGSALCVGAIHAEEPPAPPREARQSLGREIMEGLGAVMSDRVLRALVGASTLFNLFDAVLFAVYLLYLTHVLHVASGMVGVVFALGGVGGLAGALLAAPLAQRLGLGVVLVGGVALAGIGEVSIALAGGPPLAAALMVAAAEAAVQCGATIYGINGLSLRQAVTPERLQGRVNATAQSIGKGAGPLGALAGGLLGAHFGLRATALVAGLGTLSALVLLLCSPARTIRRET